MSGIDAQGLGLGVGVAWGHGASTTFAVADYGTDMAAIQAAIDAAEANGEGIVQLEAGRSYTMSKAGTRDCGLYSDIDYALTVDGSNLWLDGNGATLLLAAVPDSTCFALVLWGNGGTTTAAAPGPGSTWNENVGVRNITVNASALSDAELLALSGGGIGGVFVFGYCKRGIITGITIDKGWGVGGAITTTCASQYFSIYGNLVSSARITAMWLDGARWSHVYNNELHGTTSALYLAANTDYKTIGRGNLVENNTCYAGSSRGISLSGLDCTVRNNEIHTTGNNAHGVHIVATSRANGFFYGRSNTVAGNTITCDSGTGSSAVYLVGDDATEYNNEQAICDQNTITGNTIAGAFAAALTLDESAQNNTFTGNAIAEAVVAISVTVEGVTTATGNTVQEGRS